MHQSWKPSRKTIVIIGILVFTILIILFLSRAKDTNAANFTVGELTTKSTSKDLVERDSDSDGVLDWEESLWGLNPNKADTDGNGVDDAAEISAKKVSLGITTSTSTGTTTLTDQFSREFFSTFSALRQSGNLTKSNIAALSKQGIDSLTKFTIPDIYTEKDIVKSTSTSVVKYRTLLTTTAKSLPTKKLGTEARLLSKAIGKPKSEKLVKELQLIEKTYLTLAKRTILVPVPSKIQNTHLALANTYYRLGTAVGGLSEIYNDPALSIVYFNEYKKGTDELLKLSATMQKLK